MKANKHEINGYIYVTSEETTKCEMFWHYNHIFKTISTNESTGYKKIILCNNPNLPIQQLSTEEVEYLKSVDSFEVEKTYTYNKIKFNDFYKILIPQESIKTFSNYSEYFDKYPQETEQPKENIEEVAISFYKKGKLNNVTQSFIVGYNHAKQTLYTEDEMIDFVEEYKEFSINSNKDVISFKEWFNKHKKQ